MYQHNQPYDHRRDEDSGARRRRKTQFSKKLAALTVIGVTTVAGAGVAGAEVPTKQTTPTEQAQAGPISVTCYGTMAFFYLAVGSRDCEGEHGSSEPDGGETCTIY